MRSARTLGLIAAAFAAVALLIPAPRAHATHVACGDVITTDTVLDADLDCPSASAPGLVIGAPEIRLDLNGHLLDGVLRNEGFDDVTVANGQIAQELRLEGVLRNRILHIDLTEGFRDSGEPSVWAGSSDSQFLGLSGATEASVLFQFDEHAARNLVADGSRLRINGNGTENRFKRMRDTNLDLYGLRHVASHGEGGQITVIGHEHQVLHNRLSWLLFVRGNSNRIAGNTIATDGVAISVLGTTSNVIEGNRIVAQSTAFDSAITLAGVTGAVIRSNAISGRSDLGADPATRPSGIAIQGGSGNAVARNAISGRAHGVLLAGTVDNAVTGNVVKDVLDSGIYLYVSDSNLISGNKIARAAGNGVSLALSADQNQIVDNRSKRNVLDGIAVLAARGTGNLISGNDVRRNGDDGIDVDPTGNTLTRNAAHRNLDWGIEAVTGTIDGGGNRARHNGQPAQCLNMSCG
jgi:parallel beta-helix repeat protein